MRNRRAGALPLTPRKTQKRDASQRSPWASEPARLLHVRGSWGGATIAKARFACPGRWSCMPLGPKATCPHAEAAKGSQHAQDDALRGRDVRKRHDSTSSGAQLDFASSVSTESFILRLKFGGALPPMRTEAENLGQEGCREANERFLPSKYPSILLASSRWMHLQRTLPQIRLTKHTAARRATTKRVYPTRLNRV
ncbi:hypothetical protein Enr13x_63440 [Stieleria neptunia]|uniref:Uncharacterized protein n=1 Tax=Stieleria neptunia TaxID=2527979 RepID=A0A518I002_9BACT|nr:hypothetical protein Enr13x_63440 [Stieleria neptunia]